MSLTTVNLTGTPYQDELDLILNILKLVEGEHPNHYDGIGIPTIGYGYALLVLDINNKYVLKPDWENIVQNQAGNTLSASVISETNAALEAVAFILNDPTKTGVIKAQDAKNAIAAYKADITSNAFDFSTNTNGSLTETEAEGLLEYVYNQHLTSVQGIYSGHLNPQSKEVLALASVHYNREDLVTQAGAPSLYAAITGNPSNRARAWFEIRYQTNGSNNGVGDDGTAKRRYFESQMFGLYDNPNNVDPTETEAIIEFLTSTFSGGQTFLENMVEYETTYAHMTSKSVSDYKLQGTGYSDLPFQKIFLPIANELAEHFGLSGLTNPYISSSSDYLEGQAILAAIGGININNEVVIGLETDGVIKSTSDGNDLLIAVEDKISELSGGLGDDILIGNNKGDSLNGGLGADVLIGNGGTDYLDGGEGEDTIYGGIGADVLIGHDGDDTLDGGTGNDTMSGGKDNDTYYIDSLNDVIIENSGEGEDTLISSIDYTVTNQHEHIETIGLDTRNGGSGLELTGNELNNTLKGNQLDNIILGGKGADKLYGGEGDDHLEAGQEDVYGEGDLNELYAGDGNDTLIGGHGIDSLFGGAGDDSLWVGKGAVNVLSPTEGYIIGWEYMVGGEGFDSYYIGTSSNINTIIDSDGDGEIFVNAENIGDETYKLTGGGFWGEQTITDRPEGDLEADGYTQIHADGSTSNFTVAYELDGSQTLIAYGFNIYNFYNGMLGINLVGGRVTDVQSDLNGVLASLNFEGDFDTTEKERIKVALTKAYNQSETMKEKLIEYAITNGNSINIQASANGINTSIGSRKDSINFAATGSGVASATNNNTIYIDLNWLENNTYISTKGKAVADTLETALIHELVHLIDSLTDPLAHGEKGETVEVANTIYLEMGLPEQASYFAYDPSGNTHEANFGYTNGEEIDRAYTLLSENLVINDIDTSTGGNLDDLIIGNERDNSLTGGEGRDFLYGNEGDDRLIGEDGDDELHGGAGADLIYGGSGSDTAAYTASHSGININLNSGSAGGGDAKGDSLSNIENISGSAYSDNITGDAQDNRLEGLDGDDIISGGFGDDELIGGAGNDSLTGIYGDNIFEGNLGDDVLIGGIGNDTLTGGLGNDILKGGTGNDSYLFNVGDGEDILTDASGIDKIVFGEGITANNIRMSADTTQLHWIVELLDINGATTDDKVWIREANIDTDNQIESFEFSDGTSLGVDEIRALIEGTTSDGSTDIENVIYGNFPEGPLYGTDGNDLLIGLHGAHSYHIDAFAGHDVIDGATEHPSGELVLHDIYDWQISAIRDGNDLVINILSGEEQSIRIVDQYLGLGIDQITVRDSDPNDDSVRTVYYVDIGNRAPYHTYGSTKYFNKELNDLFRPPANEYDGFDFDGSELAELIDGTEGNDTFNGVKGDDTLTGSLEDDTLIGGSEGSSMDSNLNLLIQSYSSFDDASDESEGELSKERYSIVLPVLEYVV